MYLTDIFIIMLSHLVQKSKKVQNLVVKMFILRVKVLNK